MKKFHDALLANDDILFVNESFNKVTFVASQMHILAVDLNEINLDEDDPDTIVNVRLWRGIIYLKNVTHLKKINEEEFVPLVMHPKRWWEFCKSENKKKEHFFTERC